MPSKCAELPAQVAFPRVTWSYSTLTNYELCPRFYYETTIAKTFVEEKGTAANFGDEAHKAIQSYIMSGKPVSPGLRGWATEVDKLAAKATRVTAEAKMGVTADLQPCKFFDANVGLRVISDATFFYDFPGAAVVDWKTSSEPRETPLQLKLVALGTLVHWPELQVVYAKFVYTQHKPLIQVVKRNEIDAIVAEVTPRLERFRDARRIAEFPERPSWKCRFCPVSTCSHNERRTRR